MMSVSVYSEYQCVSYYACLLSQAGYSALMLAAMRGETEVVVELIKAGAHLNLQNKVQRLSILCMDGPLRQAMDMKFCISIKCSTLQNWWVCLIPFPVKLVIFDLQVCTQAHCKLSI